MTSPENDQGEASAGDAAAGGARGRKVAIVAAVAVLLLAGPTLAGIAVARSWAAGSSAGSATARPVHDTTAPPRAVDPYRMAADICGASQADMEHWVTVARITYPDAEGFASFLGHEADVIDHDCPQVRSTYDAATWAVADVRLGPSG